MRENTPYLLKMWGIVKKNGGSLYIHWKNWFGRTCVISVLLSANHHAGADEGERFSLFVKSDGVSNISNTIADIYTQKIVTCSCQFRQTMYHFDGNRMNTWRFMIRYILQTNTIKCTYYRHVFIGSHVSSAAASGKTASLGGKSIRKNCNL